MTAITEIKLPDFEPDKGEPLEPPPSPPVEPDLPPRRRRRSKGKDEPQPETPQPTAVVSDDDKAALAGLLTTGFGVCFEIIASRRGEHWRLTREEATRLGMAWSDPLAPFLAQHGAYIPWAVALLATSAAIMPRLQADADTATLRNAENAETA